MRSVLDRVRSVSREPVSAREIRRHLSGLDELLHREVGGRWLSEVVPYVRVSPMWVRKGSPVEATERMREEIERVLGYTG